MFLPVRCFTCAKVLKNYEIYKTLLEKGYAPGDALDAMGYKRWCCRRMYISHTEVGEQMLKYD